jgi:hypothetical protein
LVAPGAGHIVEEMPLFGILLLLPWVGGALFLLIGARFYGLPDEALGLDSSLPRYVALLIMLVVLVMSNTVAQPRSRG